MEKYGIFSNVKHSFKDFKECYNDINHTYKLFICCGGTGIFIYNEK